MSERKDLPPVGAPNFLEKVRETLSVYLGARGDKMDRGLTVGDLVDVDLISLRAGYLTGAGGSRAPVAGPGAAIRHEVDLTPPPAPSGLSAITSGNSIQVSIGPQTYRQGNGPAKVIAFGAKYLDGDALPTYAQAAVLAEFSGDVHAFPVDSASLYRIWAKSVSADGVESALAGGANGVAPTSGLLDDLSIASLTASRIRSGSITVGQFIQASNYVAGLAGWRINGDGTAELANAVVRGGVYAGYGSIGGNTIDATGIQSPGYSTGVSGWRLDSGGALYASSVALRGSIAGGAYTGYGWPASGGGFYLGAGGLLLGNYNTGQYFEVTSGGEITAPGLSISGGAATFSGALSAASGTFAGTLTAGAINAVNTINIAGAAITEHFIASGVGGDSVATVNGVVFCSITLTVPAGQTWQVTATASALASAVGGESDGVSASYGTATFGIALAYGATAADSPVVTAAGFGVSVSGVCLAQHSATFYSGESVTIQVRGIASSTFYGGGAVANPRLLVFVSKK